MLRFISGVFIVLHGFVHLLYLGQSSRRFELQPGLLWPDGSWAFSSLLDDGTTRLLASIGCVLAAIGLAAGGVGLLLNQSWWRPIVIGSAAWSALLFVLLWDGQLQRMPDKGAVGILISLGILIGALVWG